MRLLCGEEAFEVEVRPEGPGLRATVGGQAFNLQVDALGPGVFVCRMGDRSETFHCLRDGDVVHLFWRGRAYRL